MALTPARVAGCLFAALLLFTLPARAQLLDRASSAVRGDDRSDEDDDDDRDDRSDESSDLLDRASSSVRRSGRSGDTSWGGSSGASQSFEVSSWLAPRPYADGCDHQLLDPSSTIGGDAPIAWRAEAEVGYVLGGAGRGALGVRMQLPVLLDLALRASMFVEPDGGEVRAAGLGGLALEVRLLDVPGVQLRIGGEARWFHDDLGGVLGIGGSFGLDVFPGDPVVLTSELGAAVLGEAVALRGRASIGVLVDSIEIYGGYHYEGLLTAGTHVDLGGPMLGVRAWL